MITRWGRSALGISIVLVGCSRASDAPQPRAVPEPSAEAASDAAVRAAVARPADGGASPKLARPSLFHLVLRGPLTWQPCPLASVSFVGCAPPLLERLPGGGLVFAVELARAVAKGPDAPFVVELFSKGLETDILHRPVITQSPAAFRWVWSDDTLSVLSDERDAMRSAPWMVSRRLGPKGFAETPGNEGFWSAVRRESSVLALRRFVREIPNSSIYPKGSEYYANQGEIPPARIVVLSGPGPAPVVPPGVCPRAMSAAPDGTVVVAVEKCAVPDSAAGSKKIGVLRYPPKATAATVSWVTDQRAADATDVPDPVPAAASASAVWLAVDDTLHAWDGKAWSAQAPSKGAPIRSVSRAPNGDLWVVAGDRLLRRAEDGAWNPVELPEAPADPLDAEPWAVPSFVRRAFVRVPALFGNETVRDAGASPMDAMKVDASGDEVVVLARAVNEAFVLSTRARGPVVHVPSVSTQRAKLAALLPRDVPGARGRNGKPVSCSGAFLVLPEGTNPAAVRPALAPLRVAADAGVPPAPAAPASRSPEPDDAYVDESPRLAEGVVEGKTRLVVWGSQGLEPGVLKALAPLGGDALCGPAVIAREL